MRDNTFWAMAFLIVISLLIGLFFGNRYTYNQQNVTIYDTVSYTIIDTIKIEKPIYTEEKFIRYDTIWSRFEETVEHHIYDTVPLYFIPITQKHYKEPDYEAWISGYNAFIDSINVYKEILYKEVTIEKKEKKKRWGFGVQAGVTYHNKVEPYVGIGVSYNLFQW